MGVGPIGHEEGAVDHTDDAVVALAVSSSCQGEEGGSAAVHHGGAGEVHP